MATIYKSLSKSNGHKSLSANGDSTTHPKRNRQRVLILSSRGVTYRYLPLLLLLLFQSTRSRTPFSYKKNRHRHLLNDLHALLPHSRKDAKFDTKTKLYQLNELAELYNCNNVLFFEARKAKDLYLWMSKPPNGPTVKLHVQNRTSSPFPVPLPSRRRKRRLVLR